MRRNFVLNTSSSRGKSLPGKRSFHRPVFIFRNKHACKHSHWHFLAVTAPFRVMRTNFYFRTTEKKYFVLWWNCFQTFVNYFVAIQTRENGWKMNASLKNSIHKKKKYFLLVTLRKISIFLQISFDIETPLDWINNKNEHIVRVSNMLSNINVTITHSET